MNRLTLQLLTPQTYIYKLKPDVHKSNVDSEVILSIFVSEVRNFLLCSSKVTVQ